MNDYIAKPVDEKILYSKIINLVKVPEPVKVEKGEPSVALGRARITNLQYLEQRTKSDPNLMSEMIVLYLEQTPPLLEAIMESLSKKDWKTLNAAVHKMIPSFAIMGIDSDLEAKAKKIQEFASTLILPDYIYDWVKQIETSCLQACEELKLELIRIKKEKG
jgi:HPt (histidine-containing phosphotransfer) domain-containing protein